MKQFQTDDGSMSYRKSYEAEPFHTKAGAIVEALEKHTRALKIWEVQNPVIFDVCSGIGYSAACAFEEIRHHNNTSHITIYLFENDLEILSEILNLPDILEYDDSKYTNLKGKITCFKHFKNSIRKFIESQDPVYESLEDNLKIIIMFGKFEETIDFIGEDANFIFYAPFSPKITPDMWTEDKFKKLYSHLKKNGKLSTYAYARAVRDAMTRAGFNLENGPTLGRRSPSLIGIKN